eukprot:152880_1
MFLKTPLLVVVILALASVTATSNSEQFGTFTDSYMLLKKLKTCYPDISKFPNLAENPGKVISEYLSMIDASLNSLVDQAIHDSHQVRPTRYVFLDNQHKLAAAQFELKISAHH